MLLKFTRVIEDFIFFLFYLIARSDMFILLRNVPPTCYQAISLDVIVWQLPFQNVDDSLPCYFYYYILFIYSISMLLFPWQ